MTDITRDCTCSWTGTLAVGAGTLKGSTSGALDDIGLTFPRRIGPPEGMTSPVELLAAGHATCFAMAVANQIDEAGASPIEIDVACRITLSMSDDGMRIGDAEITVRADAPDASRETLEAAVATANEGCPYSRLIRDAGGTVTASLG